jgi:hypothetical protein
VEKILSLRKQFENFDKAVKAAEELWAMIWVLNVEKYKYNINIFKKI